MELIDLEFKNINLDRYHALEGFENQQSIKYDLFLNNAMEEFRKNDSLEKINKTKLKDIKYGKKFQKKDVLLGAEEFLKYNWLESIHNYSPIKNKNLAILDGTSRFFGQLFSILEVDPIINWFYSLNSNNLGSLQLNFKKPEAILIKLFIRGKTCDDICRASYISNDFSYFFDSLNELENKLEDFDYWIEDDRDKTNWNSIKLYFMRTKKNIYGKTIAFELQLVTPNMFLSKNQSSNHINYERLRLARDENVLNLYEKLYLNFDEICNKLQLNKNMEKLMEIVLTLGNFNDIEGNCYNQNNSKYHEIYIIHKKNELFLDDLKDDKLIFGSYNKTPLTKFQIINKKMVCIGSCNHYLTKQRIKICPLNIKINFIGNNILIQYSPFKNCGWGEIKDRKGQTVSFSDGNIIWIRNKIYDISNDNPQVYFNNDLVYLDKSKLTHELKIIFNKDTADYYMDNNLILKNISLKGAEILNNGYFHFGFACWSEVALTTILDIQIDKL